MELPHQADGWIGLPLCWFHTGTRKTGSATVSGGGLLPSWSAFTPGLPRRHLKPGLALPPAACLQDSAAYLLSVRGGECEKCYDFVTFFFPAYSNPLKHSKMEEQIMDLTTEVAARRSANDRLHKVQTLLIFTYGLVPILAGLDKFTHLLTDWSKYLAPVVTDILPLQADTFMYIVGVIEVVA